MSGIDSSYSEDLSDTVTNPPTYLTSLLPDTEDVILVYKNVQMDESYLSQSPCRIKKESRMDVTGSPLKYSLDNSDVMSATLLELGPTNWAKEEESQFPIDLEDAREFLNNYCLKKLNHSIPIWCICDGKDKHNIILLSVEQTREFISRRFVSLDGYLEKGDSAISTEVLQRRHLNTYTQASIEQVKKHSVCTYEILGSKISQRNIDSEFYGSVSIEVSGNNCLESESYNNMNSTMIIQTVMGQSNSLVNCFWKELLHLELCTSFLPEINSDFISDSHWIPHESSALSGQQLIESVLEIVNDTQHIPRYSQKSEGVDLKKIVSGCFERNTKDITDKLWSVLIKCPCYGILVDCLNSLFSEIAYNELNIFVTDCNQTSVGQILKGIMAGKMAVPRLTGTVPLLMLIEIGVEKLRKDYIHVLTNGGVKRRDEIDELFMAHQTCDTNVKNETNDKNRKSVFPQVAKSNLDKIEEDIKVLGHLQIFLETLLLIPSDCLQYAIKPAFHHYVGSNSAIKSFITSENNKLHELKVPIPISEVEQHIKCIDPATRIITFTTALPTFEVRTVFHQSKRCLFPPTIYKPSIPDETIKLKSMYYHCSCLTEIKSIFKRNSKC